MDYKGGEEREREICLSERNRCLNIGGGWRWNQVWTKAARVCKRREKLFYRFMAVLSLSLSLNFFKYFLFVK